MKIDELVSSREEELMLDSKKWSEHTKNVYGMLIERTKEYLAECGLTELLETLRVDETRCDGDRAKVKFSATAGVFKFRLTLSAWRTIESKDDIETLPSYSVMDGWTFTLNPERLASELQKAKASMIDSVSEEYKTVLRHGADKAQAAIDDITARLNKLDPEGRYSWNTFRKDAIDSLAEAKIRQARIEEEAERRERDETDRKWEEENTRIAIEAENKIIDDYNIREVRKMQEHLDATSKGFYWSIIRYTDAPDSDGNVRSVTAIGMTPEEAEDGVDGYHKAITDLGTITTLKIVHPLVVSKARHALDDGDRPVHRREFICWTIDGDEVLLYVPPWMNTPRVHILPHRVAGD